MGPQQVSRWQLLSRKIIIFYLPNIVLYHDPHLEVEQFINPTLFMVLLEQLKLVIEQGY